MAESDLATIDLDSTSSDYGRHGCIRVRGFFDAADVAAIRAALDRYFREIAPTLATADVVFEADGVSVRNLWRMKKHDPSVGMLEPGDALVRHCQTIHYSSPNKTDNPRCGLLLVFRGSHTQPDPQLKAAYEAGRATA